ncbi:Holliday junction resolvase RuvX [Candidatus Shapirobacteria bacterium CG09_land_8_20_14_0_10_47_13]|uniref:Putative pre-16S rRNA nuclease n=1 Tax=Candidatus Shapirobacteria bacterium CG09_land_8_20_14_0_10_47_13 TaxID=1974481 RepID=A0A2H0WMU6_9BACT|nr:MAG: Holliday junction resolvase RuvX [Candidatus Shapirobacteria bacterium CG09_land_8_20_14_0_10_47_13]
MKILGIDYGRKKIGLAVSEGILATPLTVIRENQPLAALKKICLDQQITEIVIGLPESGIVEEIKLFAKELSAITGLKVAFQDETLTSRSALAKMIAAGKKRQFRRQKEDAAAAALILESYLEEQHV